MIICYSSSSKLIHSASSPAFGGVRIFLNHFRCEMHCGFNLHFSEGGWYSVQSLSRVRLFATPWTTACQASLSITNSWSPPKPMSIELVMPSKHLILCHPFSSCPQSFPASGFFPVSQLFASGGQSIGVSASKSVLPMNTQDWSPLGWTGWIKHLLMCLLHSCILFLKYL